MESYTSLTNSEVVLLLNNKQKTSGSQLSDLEQQALEYISTHYKPAVVKDSMKDDINALMEKYSLTKTELLQLFNNPPKCELDLYVIIKNISKRMSDDTINALLKDVNKIIVAE